MFEFIKNLFKKKAVAEIVVEAPVVHQEVVVLPEPKIETPAPVVAAEPVKVKQEPVVPVTTAKRRSNRKPAKKKTA